MAPGKPLRPRACGRDRLARGSQAKLDELRTKSAPLTGIAAPRQSARVTNVTAIGWRPSLLAEPGARDPSGADLLGRRDQRGPERVASSGFPRSVLSTALPHPQPSLELVHPSQRRMRRVRLPPDAKLILHDRERLRSSPQPFEGDCPQVGRLPCAPGVEREPGNHLAVELLQRPERVLETPGVEQHRSHVELLGPEVDSVEVLESDRGIALSPGDDPLGDRPTGALTQTTRKLLEHPGRAPRLTDVGKDAGSAHRPPAAIPQKAWRPPRGRTCTQYRRHRDSRTHHGPCKTSGVRVRRWATSGLPDPRARRSRPARTGS